MTHDEQVALIERELDALAASFAFDEPGQGESIGKGALALVSDRIQDRNRREEAPGSALWLSNGEWAKTNKLKQGKPIGVLSNSNSDSMLAAKQIDGEQEITADTASMSYGVTDFAKDKAEWFSNGSIVQTAGTMPSGARGFQPARPFYELDQADIQALDSYFSDTFDMVLVRAGGHV